MKHVMFGACGVLLIVLTVICWIAIAGRSSRELEQQQALNAAVADTMEQLNMQGKYSLDSPEELVADVTSMLVERLHVKDKNLKLNLDIAGADAKKGLLSIHVTEEFTHPNGKIGKYETTATVVLEQEEGKKIYQISYTIPMANCVEATNGDQALPTEYKSYVQQAGEQVKAPGNPPDYGNKHFVAWASEDGATYTANQLRKLKVNSSMTLTAIYN